MPAPCPCLCFLSFSLPDRGPGLLVGDQRTRVVLSYLPSCLPAHSEGAGRPATAAPGVDAAHRFAFFVQLPADDCLGMKRLCFCTVRERSHTSTGT